MSLTFCALTSEATIELLVSSNHQKDPHGSSSAVCKTGEMVQGSLRLLLDAQLHLFSASSGPVRVKPHNRRDTHVGPVDQFSTVQLTVITINFSTINVP